MLYEPICKLLLIRFTYSSAVKSSVQVASAENTALLLLKKNLTLNKWYLMRYYDYMTAKVEYVTFYNASVQCFSYQHGASRAFSRVSPTEEGKAARADSGPSQPESTIPDWRDNLPKYCQNIL